MISPVYIYYSNYAFPLLFSNAVLPFYRHLTSVSPSIFFTYQPGHFKGEHLMILIKNCEDSSLVDSAIKEFVNPFLVKNPSIKTTGLYSTIVDVFIDYPNNSVIRDNHYYTRKELEKIGSFLNKDTAPFSEIILLLLVEKKTWSVESNLELATELLFFLTNYLSENGWNKYLVIDSLTINVMTHYKYADSEKVPNEIILKAEQIYSKISEDLNGKARDFYLRGRSEKIHEMWRKNLQVFLISIKRETLDIQLSKLTDLFLLISNETGIGPVFSMFILYWAKKTFKLDDI